MRELADVGLLNTKYMSMEFTKNNFQLSLKSDFIIGILIYLLISLGCVIVNIRAISCHNRLPETVLLIKSFSVNNEPLFMYILSLEKIIHVFLNEVYYTLLLPLMTISVALRFELWVLNKEVEILLGIYCI